MQKVLQPEERPSHILERPRDLIPLQLQNLQVSELNEGLVFDGGNVVVVEVQVFQREEPLKRRSLDSSNLVFRQVEVDQALREAPALRVDALDAIVGE